MVELEDLEKKLFELKHRITGKKVVIAKLKEMNEEANIASKERENSEKRLGAFQKIRDTYESGTNEWNNADLQVKKAKQDFDEKTKIEEEAKKKIDMSKLTKLEHDLKDLQEESNQVLMTLQKDPDFNDELVKALEEEFDKKLTQKDRELARVDKKEKTLVAMFNSDQKYGPLVSELKSVYEEMKKYDLFSTDEKSIQARKRYIEIVDILRQKISKDKGFEKLVLTDKDFQSICNGEYKIEQYERDKANISSEKKKIESDKQVTISKISALKEGPTSEELAIVENAIKENERKIKINEQNRNSFLKQKKGLRVSNLEKLVSDGEEELKGKTENVDNIQKRIKELEDRKKNRGTAKARIKELSDKKDATKGNKDALNDRLKIEQEAYKNALDKLRDTGYITTVGLRDLKDPNSELSKKYKIFFDADYKLRKAFEIIKTNPSEKAKENLKKAITDYHKAGEDLKSLSGYEIKDWQNYLRRNLEYNCKQNGEIDEVYYPDTIKNKYNNLGKSYKCKENSSYKEAGKKLENLDEYERQVLEGEDVNIGDVFRDSKEYHENMNQLADDLKISVQNLYGFLKGAIVEKGKKIWAIVKNFISEKIFKFKKAKFKSNVSEPENLSELKKEVVKSRNACDKTNEELKNIGGLTPDEEKELSDLLEDEKNPHKIENELKNLRSNLSKAKIDQKNAKRNLQTYRTLKKQEDDLENEENELQEENENLYRVRESVLSKKVVKKRNDKTSEIKDTNPKLLKEVKRRMMDDDGR